MSVDRAGGIRVEVPAGDGSLVLPLEVVTLKLTSAETGDEVHPPGKTTNVMGRAGTFAELEAIEVSVPDYHPVRLLSPSREEVHEVRLRSAVRVWVTVRGPDHRRLPGAPVQVADVEGWDLTDAAGTRGGSGPPFDNSPGFYLARPSHEGARS